MRTVKRNTSDADAASNAAALLAAADTLDADRAAIRTVSDGARIDLSAPAAVFTASGLTGGVTAPDNEGDPAPAQPPAHLSVAVHAYDPANGDDVNVMLAAAATAPPRAVTVAVGTFTVPLTTGQTNNSAAHFPVGWPGGTVTLTDDASGTSTSGQLAITAQDSYLTLTLDIP
jgi:hypothetical protein